MRLIVFLFFIFLSSQSIAQNKDYILIVNSKWNEKKIDKGIILKQKHFKDSSLFNSNQFISIVEIEPKALKRKRENGNKDGIKTVELKKIH